MPTACTSVPLASSRFTATLINALIIIRIQSLRTACDTAPATLAEKGRWPSARGKRHKQGFNSYAERTVYKKESFLKAPALPSHLLGSNNARFAFTQPALTDGGSCWRPGRGAAAAGSPRPRRPAPGPAAGQRRGQRTCSARPPAPPCEGREDVRTRGRDDPALAHPEPPRIPLPGLLQEALGRRRAHPARAPCTLPPSRSVANALPLSRAVLSAGPGARGGLARRFRPRDVPMGEHSRCWCGRKRCHRAGV